jgi:hypothetical protein
MGSQDRDVGTSAESAKRERRGLKERKKARSCQTHGAKHSEVRLSQSLDICEEEEEWEEWE